MTYLRIFLIIFVFFLLPIYDGIIGIMSIYFILDNICSVSNDTIGMMCVYITKLHTFVEHDS